MSDPNIDIRCDVCGMPLIEGDLFTVAMQLLCDNCMKTRPHQLLCDFCSGADPTWTYESDPFQFLAGSWDGDSDSVQVSPVYESGNRWAACDPCHEIIQARSVALMVDRCMNKVIRSDSEPDITIRQVMAVYFNEVFNSLKDSPRRGMDIDIN